MTPSRIHELNHFRQKTGVPAVIGGIAELNKDVQVDVVGLRRRGHSDPASVTDKVHIGSCCKMLTATLFGTYVEEGLADWNMPIAELFPDLTDKISTGWRRRSVEELFYCLSGMMANPPNSALKSGFSDPRPLIQQRSEMARLAFSGEPKKPGKFMYSNMSYIVMGAAIDRLSGSSYEIALHERVLGPLGIESVGFGPPPEIWGHGPKFVIGTFALFKGNAADPNDPESDNPPLLSSAGTLHVTVHDWSKLLSLFLVNGAVGIVEDATIERILTVPDTKSAHMAMGWAPALTDGISYGAQGSNVRWSATALMDEERKKLAFVVCNDGRTRVLMQSAALAHKLLEISN